MLKRILNDGEYNELEKHYQSLYSKNPENNDEYVFSGVDGCTHKDLVTLKGVVDKQKAKDKEYRAKISELNDKLKPYDDIGIDPDELTNMVNEYPNLQANASQDHSEAINKAVEDKVSLVGKRHKKELDTRDKKITELETTLNELQGTIKTSSINSVLDIALEKSGVRPDAKDTVRFMGRNLFDVDEEGNVIATTDLNGAKAGMSPDEVLDAWKTTNSFLWGETKGGGSLGGNGNAVNSNPWSRSGWDHEKQYEYEEKHGIEAAKEKAIEAGTVYGGDKPEPKTA